MHNKGKQTTRFNDSDSGTMTTRGKGTEDEEWHMSNDSEALL